MLPPSGAATGRAPGAAGRGRRGGSRAARRSWRCAGPPERHAAACARSEQSRLKYAAEMRQRRQVNQHPAAPRSHPGPKQEETLTEVNHAALKRCSCPDHEGPNPIPASEFSPSSGRKLNSRCRACRARMERQRRRLASPVDHGKFRPCLICGQPTASVLGVCQRTRACGNEYHRLFCEARPDIIREVNSRRNEKRRGGRPAKPIAVPVPMKPCSICAKPTRAALGVCAGPSCINERRRLERAVQKRIPSVYGVWFPAVRVLKVGFTTDTRNFIFAATARRKARCRGWDVEGAQCIWRQPGDLRTEAWIQSTLAFRWLPGLRAEAEPDL